jgi:amino acid adenylation domain-containing protein
MRPALWVGGQTFSYGDLEQAGKKLMDTCAAGPGSVIAIAARRHAPFYAAVFGAFAARVCYVPLNPRWPEARIRSILDQARPDSVVMDQATANEPIGQTMAASGRHSVYEFDLLPGREATIGARAYTDVSCMSRGYSSDGLAYIMFTSGSTGTPKGVPISANAVAHYLASISAITSFEAGERFIQTVELTFDLSVHDMMLCWSSGGMLVVVPESSAPLGPRFVRQLDVTSWLSVPSVAAEAKARGLLRPGSMPSLRTTFFCGEALPSSLAESWLEAAPNSRVLNIYGPTEATIAFSAFEIHRDRPLTQAVVPLGYPIGGQSMRVDPSGELLLSGPQLSSGYLLDPARTARSFIEDGERQWYRTGDLASFEEPWGFQFRGRLDSQVKLRGYRIELGEIEAALRWASGSDLVAAVPFDASGPSSFRKLAAFVAGTTRSEAEIHASVRAQLPEYMAPTFIRALAAMPKNVNDKVDYLTLRDMATNDS